MSVSDRRKAYAEGLRQRQEEGFNRKDDSGKFKSIWKDNSNMKFWKCSDDEHSINIIPYIAGGNNPHVKAGKPAYILDIWVHYKVGINEDTYICLNRTYGQPCPICEYQTALRKKANDSEDPDVFKAEIAAYNPKRRAVYNIQCLDNNKEVAKGVQQWDVSHYLFERELLERSKRKKGGGFVYFSDPDEGKIISFRRKGSGPTNTEFAAMDFEDRDEIVSDELLASALCLDDLVHVPTYEEVNTAFRGTKSATVEDEEEEETERKPRTYAVKNEEVDVPDEVTEEVDETEKEETTWAEDECPLGGTFGTMYGKFDECDDCVNVDACVEKKTTLRKAQSTSTSPLRRPRS